ncbi:transporter [Clostridium carboxidivorans P7]|uniref:Auxin Efflux Carrier n=1 Tax=Clostridium carboxidivorans P7 TaxID=536227 RepID=C6PV97_9CLOT|nr:AEC family transporter [Clostridium carboxidivorans]AKN30727.1 transporter [Clostridium carboxidivorans P7]EET86827.1 Auxin Efflux Carrier [Clostridium carboxidivorans P7]EFG88571.1 transporter, auxin efflux carrier (AEC) family protein [Clostridium carboxidivorans P7]
MNNLIFSFNVIMPIFLVVFLGYFLRKINMIDDSFVNMAIKFNFRVGLATLLFKNIYTAKFSNVFNIKLILFVFLCIIISIAALWLIVPMFIKDKKRISAMIHTIYRSNFVLLGIPLGINMFGQGHIASIAILLPITIPTYNFFAVLILCAFGENENKNTIDKIKATAIGVIKNPLIIASFLGIIFQVSSIKLPIFIDRAVSDVASLGTPLALVTLGAQFKFDSALKNLKYSIIATIGRLILLPGIIIILAILVGFRGYELGAIFILFSAPSAVSSYVMAKEMNSDYELTGDVVLLTTFFSMFTIFAGIYMLKATSLI